MAGIDDGTDIRTCQVFCGLDFRMHMGDRIKAERERLGLTIPEFAALAGAAKNTVIDWQNNKSTPPAGKLAALVAAGVDVLYVLTGQQAPNASHATHLAGRRGLPDGARAHHLPAVSRSEPALSDRARLQAAISAVEEGLAETRRKLAPDKRAELILAAYDLMAQPQQSRDNIIRLVRTAA